LIKRAVWQDRFKSEPDWRFSRRDNEALSQLNGLPPLAVPAFGRIQGGDCVGVYVNRESPEDRIEFLSDGRYHETSSRFAMYSQDFREV
jgi:hypothetical protein